tara:strand:- start:3402 stop:4706 length:1305 start_codon:yes stop_codon:yes gene_type:complete
LTRLASCILIFCITAVCHGATGVAVFGSFIKESGALDLAKEISDQFDMETNLQVVEIDGRNYYRVVSATRSEREIRKLIDTVRRSGAENTWYLAEPTDSSVVYQTQSTSPQFVSDSDQRTEESGDAPEEQGTQALTVSDGLRVRVSDEDIPRIDGAKISIDGKLDEAVWSEVDPFDGLSVLNPDTLEPGRFETLTRVFYDDSGIYVAGHMKQPTNTLVERLSARDESINRDGFSIMLDTHLIQRWAWDVATNPRILACASGALGDNVLLWSTNWFIKEPGDRKIVSFHQDASYWGLEPHEVITAWIALSDAPTESGPMVFIPGSHKSDLIDHEDTYAPNNLLTRGQVVKKDLSDKELIEAPLKAGQMSLHHVRTTHGSRANTSDDRRIGMVLRYCSARVKQTRGPDNAVLVSGKDEYQHFELLNEPRNDLERPR